MNNTAADRNKTKSGTAALMKMNKQKSECCHCFSALPVRTENTRSCFRNGIRRKWVLSLFMESTHFRALCKANRASPASAFVSVCAGADVTKPVLRTVWKTVINALSGAFPMLKMLDPLADVLFDTTADALSTINENIVQLRDEMNERIDELESRLDYSTKQMQHKCQSRKSQRVEPETGA